DQGGDPASAGQGLGGGGRRSGSGTAEQVRQAGPKGDQRAEQPVGDEVRDLVAEGKLGKRQVISRDAREDEDQAHVGQGGRPSDTGPQAPPASPRRRRLDGLSGGGAVRSGR